jgi:hypothetical protein
VDDDRERLHSQLLSDAYVGPGARLAYLVHEFGWVDHEPGGAAKIAINVLGRQGSLPNGSITVDILRGQVAAGYTPALSDAIPMREAEAQRRSRTPGRASRGKGSRRCMTTCKDCR